MTKTNPEDAIQKVVDHTLALETGLQVMMQNPYVQKYLETQKRVNEEAEAAWKLVEEQMIANDVKKISGNWGSLTIAERMDFDVDLEQLPPRFKKTVADTTKIRKIYQLEGKPIKGATPKTKKYLTKRLKIGGSDD